MPPKKPIRIVLKNVKQVDTAAHTQQCWDQANSAIDAVFGVPVKYAPEAVGSADAAFLTTASSSARGLSARALHVDGIRARHLLIHREVSPTISLQRVHSAASELARSNADETLVTLRRKLEEHVPRALLAWIKPAADAVAAATTGESTSVDTLTIMRHVVAAWEFTSAAIAVVAEAFAYVDNTYVKLNSAEGGIAMIGTNIASRLLVEGNPCLFDLVCAGFVHAVSDDREGNAVKRTDLSSCRALLLATHAFHSRVETPLSEAADKHFTRLGNILVYSERVSAAEYVARIEREMAAEDERLRVYAHPSSKDRIQQLVQERLVKAHVGYMASTHMRGLVNEGHLDVLSAIYRLSRLRFVRQEDGVRKAFREFVAKSAAEVLGVDASLEDTIVDLLNALNTTATAVIRRCFAVGTTGTDSFSTAKKDAFEAALRSKGDTAAELLAKYFDTLLREGANALQGRSNTGPGGVGADDVAALSPAEQLDRALVDGMKLFSFIPGKDIFEALYMRHFGKRLVLQRSVGIEHERVVIDELRAICGPSVALKLNGMLKDVDMSKDIQASFQQTRFLRVESNGSPLNGGDGGGMGMGAPTTSMEAGGGMGTPALSELGPADSTLIHAQVDPASSLPRQDTASSSTTVGIHAGNFDFNCLVLTEGYWPTFNSIQPTIPAPLARQMDFFKTFYLSKFSGRRLNWNHALAHCVVKARWPKSRKELVVSFLQAMILHQFNGVDRMTYGELLRSMGVDGQSEEMTCAIIGLYAGNAKVLQREKTEGLPALPKPKRGDPRIVVREEDVITYNAKFAHRLVKIRVNQVQLRETKEEVEETTEKVMADRHFIVDAAIVRFMKSRKEARHNDLVPEVISMLRFEAQPVGVKKRIEHLIEREYLERDDKDPSLYRYLA